MRALRNQNSVSPDKNPDSERRCLEKVLLIGVTDQNDNKKSNH